MEERINLIRDNKSVALLAPTFAIDFKYPAIIGMLKKLGFDEVTELTYGARMVNWAYAKYIKDNPDQKFFIASPCPTVVAFVQSQYPELVKYLMPVVSPLVAMAKVYKKHNPGHRVVFISPCLAKKIIEAPKFKEFIDDVITLQELKQMFAEQGIKEEDFTEDYQFDSFIREYTKIYPISGGLASTSHIKSLFREGEILITDGIENIKKALDDIKHFRSQYRFFDLLNCDGGCIGGPSINNRDLSMEEKKRIVLGYTTRSSEENMGKHKGEIKDAEEVDLNTSF